jgi:hypothetical protein
MTELHRHCQCDYCTGDDCVGLEDIRSRHHTPAPEYPGDINAREELHKISVGIHCPTCDWKQSVPLDEWLFQSKYGHGYTCGSEECPSHTYLVRDDIDEHDTAIVRAATLAAYENMDWGDIIRVIEKKGYTVKIRKQDAAIIRNKGDEQNDGT